MNKCVLFIVVVLLSSMSMACVTREGVAPATPAESESAITTATIQEHPDHAMPVVGSTLQAYSGMAAGIIMGPVLIVVGLLMLAYGMALGAPVPVIASGVVGVKTYAEKTAHLGMWFKKAAGVLLVAFGLYYLLPWIWGA